MSKFQVDVSHIHAKDVMTAQGHLRSAIEIASAKWIPVDAIADALALELVAAWSRCRPAEALPARLAHLVNQLSAPQPPQSLN